MKLNLKDLWQQYLTVQTDDEDRARRGRILLVVLLIIIVADILSVFQVFIFHFDRVTLAVVLVGLVGFVSLVGFTRRGHVWTTPIFLLILVLLILFLQLEPDSIMALAYALPIVLAPLIAASWVAIPMAGIGIVSMYVINDAVRGDVLGFLPIVLMGIFGAAAWLTSRNLEQALQVVEHSAESLRATNQELQSGRVLLEQHTTGLERRARYLQATADVAREMASELALQDLLDRAVRSVSQRFDFYHVGIFLLDKAATGDAAATGVTGGAWAVLRAVSSVEGQRLLARGHRVEVGARGASAVGWVTQSGNPHISVGRDAAIGDLAGAESLTEKADRGLLDLPDTRSVMTLPLRAQGEIMGALDMHSTDSNAFAEEDAVVLQALADQVALAINNARLFEQLERSLETQRQLYGDLSRDAWRALLQARPDLAYRSTERGVFKLTHAGETAPLEAVNRAASVVAQAFAAGELVAGKSRVASEGRAASVADEWVPLAIPVRLPNGDIIGVIDTYKSAANGDWTPDEQALLREVVERLGSALESAQFYYEIQQQAAREQLTHAITTRIRRSLDVEMVAQQAVQELQAALQAGAVTVRLGTAEQLMAALRVPVSTEEANRRSNANRSSVV